MRYRVLFSGVLVATFAAVACSGSSNAPPPMTPGPTIAAGDFQARVDNRFFPLTPGSRRVYEGKEAEKEGGTSMNVRVESTVLTQTETIAGVEVTVVEVNDFEDGELVEHTLDYYAQHRDGSVYYFGERIDEYEGGKVVGHSGQWLAGDGANFPGVFMPADPRVGLEFQQEGARGVAQDRGKVIAADVTSETPAGKFTGCVKIDEYDPLEDFSVVNLFCPGMGLVHEEPPGGTIDLVGST